MSDTPKTDAAFATGTESGRLMCGLLEKENEDMRETIKCADSKIDESEWAQKYRDACIMISDQSEKIDRLHSALLRTTGSLGLIIAGAGASAPGHKASLAEAKEVLAKANKSDETQGR